MRIAPVRRTAWVIAAVGVLAALLVPSCQVKQETSGQPRALDSASQRAGEPDASASSVPFETESSLPEPSESSDSGAAGFDGRWVGRTEQARPISFTVDGGTLTKLAVAGEFAGAACTVKNNDYSFSGEMADVVNDGFVVGSTMSGVSVEGRFTSPTTATGTARFTPDDVARDAGCTPTGVTWRATKRSGA